MIYFHALNIKKTISAAIMAALLITIAGPHSTGHARNFRVPASEVVPENNAFVFPVANFDDYKARHYVYKPVSGESVRFFIVKSKDGVIRAAFDACDVCWKNKKGYVQQGNMMVCVNCGMKFPSNRINEARGGCNPAPLSRTIKNKSLIISADDVLNRLGFFK